TATPRPIVVPTATPTATATATPTPPPVQFTVYPLKATYSTCATNISPPPVTLTLDNTKSTVDVSWQAKVTDMLPSGAPWASITDANGTPLIGGTVPAGKMQTIIVNPVRGLCTFSTGGKSWHVSIATTNAGTFTFAYTVS